MPPMATRTKSSSVKPASRQDRRPASPAANDEASSPGRWVYLLPALGLGVLVFAQTLGFDFVNWDDDVNIVENRGVTTFDLGHIWTETVIGNYNPLTITTFAIEWALVGKSAALYHFDNLWLHLLTVGFVYFLGLRLRLGSMAAGLLAALFAIHPMRVESVAWVTERKDVLFGAFYFAALLVYERHRQRGSVGQPDGSPAGRLASWHWGVAALFALALLSKIQAVSLPLAMICLDYLRQRELRWGEVLAKAPYLAMSLAVGLLGVYFLNRDGSLEDATTYDVVDRIAVGAYALVVYLVKAVLPYEHSPLYPYPSRLPVQAYVSIGLAVATVGLLVWGWRRGWVALTFALGFFLVNVVFMLQVLGAGQGYLADRFTYVGYFGLFWGMAYGAQRLVASGKVPGVRVGLAVYVVLLTALAFGQTRIWRDGDTLWAHVAELYPNTSTAYGNRGLWLRERGQTAEALALFTRAIEADPRDGAYLNSRGKLHFDEGRVDEAIRDYTTGIEREGELGELYINRGAAYAAQGDYARAEADLAEGLRLDPDNFNGYMNRSLLFYTMGRIDDALRDYDWMLREQPERHALWHERGAIKIANGRIDEGRADVARAIEIAGGDPAAAEYRATLAE